MNDIVDKIAPPSLFFRLLEGRAPLEAGQLFALLPVLRLQSPRGHGEPVIVLPGFMTSDGSTMLLRRFLADIGYTVEGWGRGVNRGRMLDHLPPLVTRVRELAMHHDTPVRLVGWSRGGMLAREIAREVPDHVDRVLTIGSPVRGGAGASAIASWVRRETGMTDAALKTLLRDRASRPITVPVRAIYSRYDGVVAAEACIDHETRDASHYEITGSHAGMGTNTEVFRLVPKLLAESIDTHTA